MTHKKEKFFSRKREYKLAITTQLILPFFNFHCKIKHIHRKTHKTNVQFNELLLRQNTVVITTQFKNWNLTRALPCVPILILTPIITTVWTFTVITSLCFFTVSLPKYTSSGHYCITCLLKKLSHFESLLLSTGSLSALSFPHIYLQLSVVSLSLIFAHCLLMVSSTESFTPCVS